ncbi:parathyroid hormone 2 receptor [Brachionus plicatilis]|uniref:Parathyroid hormone 2 receptor n=1 Tax=Brachionus plicatilis TaxID=10195 RepID=A0A3M7P2F8_BRAPC|nr:parathyroid hormone 2 receptor [Brachionus plicatilis]
MKYELIYFLLLIIFPSNSLNETYHYHSRVDNMTLCIKPHLVKIGPEEQNLLIKNELKKCISTMNDPEKCPIKWDTVMCWPETNVNETVGLPCANYVNKFNKKHKAYIHCRYNSTLNRAEWTKTNYSKCLTYEETDFCNTTTCSLELN